MTQDEIDVTIATQHLVAALVALGEDDAVMRCRTIADLARAVNLWAGRWAMSHNHSAREGAMVCDVCNPEGPTPA